MQLYRSLYRSSTARVSRAAASGMVVRTRGKATAANADAANADANAAHAAPTPTPSKKTKKPIVAGPPLQHVNNFRDLALHTAGLVRPGLLYRCAGPVRATEADAAAIYGALGVRELLDLRSRDELELEGCAGSPAFRGGSFAAYSRDPVTRRSLPDPRATVMVEAWAWPGGEEARGARDARVAAARAEAAAAEGTVRKGKAAAAGGAGSKRHRQASTSGAQGGNGDDDAAAAAAALAARDEAAALASDDGRLVRRHIPLLQKRRYIRALLRRMPLSEAARVAAQLLVDRRAAMARVLSVVNSGGLEMLYECILEEGGPEIAACAHASLAALERGRPILFFCKAGKDRTGLLAALLLLSSGVPRELVLDDYHASDAFHAMGLAGLEREPGLAALDKRIFERAPRQAAEYALDFLDRVTAGGGAGAYLETHGFGRLAQARLRELLRAPEEEGGGGEGRAARRQAKL